MLAAHDLPSGTCSYAQPGAPSQARERRGQTASSSSRKKHLFRTGVTEWTPRRRRTSETSPHIYLKVWACIVRRIAVPSVNRQEDPAPARGTPQASGKPNLLASKLVSAERVFLRAARCARGVRSCCREITKTRTDPLTVALATVARARSQYQNSARTVSGCRRRLAEQPLALLRTQFLKAARRALCAAQDSSEIRLHRMSR